MSHRNKEVKIHTVILHYSSFFLFKSDTVHQSPQRKNTYKRAQRSDQILSFEMLMCGESP